ncbi:dihydroflavonal-4-reductase [Penicillium malachiteum]|uniref:dihydroflavonal-4-reductase n=1 Tax=Penicillium malachiteum TaxID=1324776 RepID=UPI0025475AFD|nr:dihydroflavonal-4-reductase [Penicillium malachiteum]KAJ5725285.1 dihydroflavonal-4-reductase [Penicillium malachiteum]
MSKSLVFITGATGFIGSHVVASTLQAGYRVRLSIRKAEQESLVRSRYPEFSNNIEVVVLPDLSKPEAFSENLHGVDYVFHLASPMPGRGNDIHRDYVDPAVNATLAILNAAQAFKQIKKVVIVSSVLALAPANAVISQSVSVKDNTGEPNPVDLDATFPEGFSGHALKYSASKIKAHEATRDFLVNNTPHYNLITFHPVFVLGDSLIQQSAEDLGGMNGIFWMSLFSEKPQLANAWVHVRDVADAHVKALEIDIETGKEFILSRPVVSWDEAVSYVKEKYPALGCKLQGPFQGGWTVDTTAADQTFGPKWRSESTIIDDIVNQQLGFRAKASSI